MTDHRADAQRGREAQELLLRLEPYLAALEGEYVAAWKLLKTADLREEAWQRQRVLADVRRHIGIAIDGGKVAEELLKQN